MIKCTQERITSGWSSDNLLEVDLVVFRVTEINILNREALHLRIVITVDQDKFCLRGFLNQL